MVPVAVANWYSYSCQPPKASINKVPLFAETQVIGVVIKSKSKASAGPSIEKGADSTSQKGLSNCVIFI